MKMTNKWCFILLFAVSSFLLYLNCGPAQATLSKKKHETSPREVLDLLKAGNTRFAAGKSIHPNTEAARLIQAGRENQADHAYATVVACSDSRVPVERIFDSGVMDLFVVRIAGNVCGDSEAGSIEYGLLHVHTPVLVVLGHTQCGAVSAAVAQMTEENHHPLEHNIPPLLNRIKPAVRRSVSAHPKLKGPEIIPHAIEENVWQTIADLFHKSPDVRKHYREGKVIITGAVYDVSTGKIQWLPETKVKEIYERQRR